MFRETDVAWLAGLLEGEGSFDAKSTGYPRIHCNMTDHDVLERIQILFGGLPV